MSTLNRIEQTDFKQMSTCYNKKPFRIKKPFKVVFDSAFASIVDFI